MNIREKFKAQANIYSDLCAKLYEQAEILGEKILFDDIYQKYEVNTHHGVNAVNLHCLSEIIIEGRNISLNCKEMKKYKTYVLYFEKEFNFPYLGFTYKDDIISPHHKDSIGLILNKYSDEDLVEITQEINDRMQLVNDDLLYIKSHESISDYKYYYKNYNGLFEGEFKFGNFDKVIEDYLK